MIKEILAPAGDKDSFISAVNSGADAIYLGLNNFSARKSAENFSLDNLKFYIDYAHIFKIKIYVAMNTLIKDSELAEFLSALLKVHNCGADAIILQDLFLGKEIKKLYPQITVHLSTQGGCCNEDIAKLAKSVGFSRVILSRETRLDDIKKISNIIQTECFVQGALCSSFSGQCYMSSFIGKNSGNRGHCKQPCRRLYKINRKGFENYSYKLSLADLCLGKSVFDLIEAGVSSFKIEGRMRRSEYVASSVNYYRALLDGYSGDEIDKCLSDLKRCYNRGNYTKGLAFGQDKKLVYPYSQSHIGEKIGTLNIVADKPFCKSKHLAMQGDCFKLIRNNIEVGSATTSIASKDSFFVLANGDYKVGDSVHITTDKEVCERLLSKIRHIGVSLTLEFCEGACAKIKAQINNKEYTFEGCDLLPPAVTRALSKEEIKGCFNKVGIYPFAIEYDEINIGNVFLTKAQQNAIRREFYEFLFTTLSAKKVVIADEQKISSLLQDGIVANVSNKSAKAVIVSDLDIIQTFKSQPDVVIYKPFNYYDKNIIYSTVLKNKELSKKLYLYLPAYASGDDIKQFQILVESFEGVYSDGTYAIEFCRRLNKKLFAGTGFNIFNRLALAGTQEYDLEHIALSKELTNAQISKLIETTSKESIYSLAFGDIKLMDLLFCPFSKDCFTCDKKERYLLTDENNRSFTLRRYMLGECRFELYNCVNLISEQTVANLLFDFSIIDKEYATLIYNNSNQTKLLKDSLGDFTYGYAKNEVN